MLTEAEIETVESRADVITYTVLAEMEHFQRNRVTDFQVYMQQYLHGQIAFFRQVLSSFEYHAYASDCCIYYIFIFIHRKVAEETA